MIVAKHSKEPTAMDCQDALAIVVETMRDMSRQVDPQEMVRNYAKRIRKVFPIDRNVSLSRRSLEKPYYRITRSDIWSDTPDPWRQKDRLPVLSGGVLGELLYGDEPRIINDFRVDASDPAVEHLIGMRSLVAIPHFDEGVGLNMVVHMRREPGTFSEEGFPQLVLLSNLFGRATKNLVLTRELEAAYQIVDRELEAVAGIQRSLLPTEIPEIPGLELATYYQTSRHAGGDYYDFFPLPDGMWGILVADVSGHGTPAAVVMAITHAIAHHYPGPPMPPDELLKFVNEHLTRMYTNGSGRFVTAFYGIYDSAARRLMYSSAGHPPPRRWDQRRGRVVALEDGRALPLGIDEDQGFSRGIEDLSSGDGLLFYTDGITETFGRQGEMFGTARLEEVLLARRRGPRELIADVLKEIGEFSNGAAALDDRTLLAARVG